MELEKIRELALANGFSLKEQASGNMDLHSYVYEFANALLKEATPEGFVLVDKKHTEDWYFDENENMWWEADGIDSSLYDLNPGKVQAVEHKEYLITESNTLYAAVVWDESNNQVGFWKFFKTKEEAEKVAAHCKAMVEVQEKTHD